MPQYVLTRGGDERVADVAPLGDGLYAVTIDGRAVTVDARIVEESVCSFIADGTCYEVHFSRERDVYTLLIGGEHYEVAARNRRVRAAFSAGGRMLTGRQVVQAPMPGRVVRVLVERGSSVKAGDPLLVLEAMKMENQLRSPVDGVVAELEVVAGQVVATGDKLVVVE